MKEDKLVTIRDFKVMMEGMDMVLGDDWTPTDAQWKRIREKINAMIDTSERPNTRYLYSGPPLPVDPSLSTTDNELIRSFPAVPVADGVPIGEVPTQSALIPPQIPAEPVPEGEKVHRTDEFV